MKRVLLIGLVSTTVATAMSGTIVARASTLAVAQEPTTHPATPAPTRTDPQQYLETAKRALDAISLNAVNHDAQKQMAQIRKDFTGFEEAYQVRSTSVPSSAAKMGTGTKEGSKDALDWKTMFDAVERDLTSILGSGESVSVSSTTLVSATSGVEPDMRRTGTAEQSADVAVDRDLKIGVKNLDPSVRTQLEKVRTSIELFYDATTSGSATRPAQ